jgi:hypothetical protein
MQIRHVCAASQERNPIMSVISGNFSNQILSLAYQGGGQSHLHDPGHGLTAGHTFGNGNTFEVAGDPVVTANDGGQSQSFYFSGDANLIHSNANGENTAALHVNTAPLDPNDPNGATVVQSGDYWFNPNSSGQAWRLSFEDTNGATNPGGLDYSLQREAAPSSLTELGRGITGYQQGSGLVTNQSGETVDQAMVDKAEGRA